MALYGSHHLHDLSLSFRAGMVPNRAVSGEVSGHRSSLFSMLFALPNSSKILADILTDYPLSSYIARFLTALILTYVYI